MQELLARALAAGNEHIVAWADVLDRINVFPVADGDTGRNLVISLGPLREAGASFENLSRELLLSARGNSGNMAARFLSSLLQLHDLDALIACCERGRDLAYGAVKEPKQGTILTLFDVLATSLKIHPPHANTSWASPVLEDLEKAVKSTTHQLPELKKAGVVDAGALGMFVFLEACLYTLAGREAAFSSVADTFKDSLDLADSWSESPDEGYCLDVVLQVEQEGGVDMKQISIAGESLVAIHEGDHVKVHLHTRNEEEARQRLESVGSVIRWAADDLGEQTRRFARPRKGQALHIMTDAAGAVTRDDAARLGMTLLDSYITLGKTCLPETYVDPGRLFEIMRKGGKVSTSQASLFERHQCYHKVLTLHPKVLYLCVGSFYTGNFQAARDWKDKNDPEDRLILIDSGAASGRLGLAAIAAARLSLRSADPEDVVAFAKKAVLQCQEIVFLDKLQWLAAGGRMSKTGAFFGDVFHIKPVVSP
ncbi:MAG: DAK2 domain-containing protein, partial [Deltaproteobacteria bacterium]|nr:DAK2 domain-containing protein [Deltaproteobacteria bacterium]